ncbi:hypothetical protein CVT26_004886 [Gymnopilus dilepis]|uniref:Uncharacterized protein n=1 Tax=Gymnopilus dilepis TaxID=231916 RepID=A0A409W8F9_9AGAR|nr:hypothetical protein CVT26_004886 [Gymnopilus dilepis]
MFLQNEKEHQNSLVSSSLRHQAQILTGLKADLKTPNLKTTMEMKKLAIMDLIPRNMTETTYAMGRRHLQVSNIKCLLTDIVWDVLLGRPEASSPAGEHGRSSTCMPRRSGSVYQSSMDRDPNYYVSKA